MNSWTQRWHEGGQHKLQVRDVLVTGAELLTTARRAATAAPTWDELETRLAALRQDLAAFPMDPPGE